MVYSNSMNGIEQAVKAAKSSTALANLIGTSRQRVDYWLKTGRPSPTYCTRIRQVTGVPETKLRPDVFIKTYPKCDGRASPPYGCARIVGAGNGPLF